MILADTLFVSGPKDKNLVEKNPNKEIAWSSSTVSKAAKDLDNGAKSVYVKNRSQAEELFLRKYQGYGYRNTTGKDAMDTKNLYGEKSYTYHWDDIMGNDGYLIGHGRNNPDAQKKHLQIHPPNGKIIRIFFK